MRDRRNTHLSNVSTSSSSSTDSFSASSSRTSMSEKDLEDQTTDTSSYGNRITRQRTYPFLYTIFTSICLALFITIALKWHLPAASLSWPASKSSIETPRALPTDAGAHSFIDRTGRDRWTIYIPESGSLSTSDYQHICRDAERLRSTRWLFQRLWTPSRVDTFHDSSFMDIDEAGMLGVLPDISTQAADTCQKSLTFVMDGDASFGKTLIMLWLSYGFAKRDGRAFFLDDSKWAYGRFDSYFVPLPRPGCAPPAPSQVVPCPLQAKHVVVTPATARSTFDESVHNIFRRQVDSQERTASVYNLLRSGYESSFHMIGDDVAYVQERVDQFRQQAMQHHHPLVGMHIRRGDLRPFELQFSQDYLPVEKFTDAVKHLLGPSYDLPGSIVLASDDPDIMESTELILAASPDQLYKSQERIQLATKLALDRTSPAEPIREPGSPYVKHVDENAGWDGGFYTALFDALGDARPRAQRLLRPQEAPSKDTLRMRELIGRGYLLDMAVLSQMDGVVCAVSSAACRMLGVMMGSEAVQSGKWLNVDDNRPWSWDGRR